MEHKCKNKQFYLVEVNECNDDEEACLEEIENEDTFEDVNPQISAHAISGIASRGTML